MRCVRLQTKWCNGFVFSADKVLSGKVVIVTGASSGIGAAIAARLASAGAKVAMAARRQDMLEAGQRVIEQQGGVAISVKCDVTDRNNVRLTFVTISIPLHVRHGKKKDLRHSAMFVSC